MKFACIYLSDGLVPIWQPLDRLILVKYFCILVVLIEISAKLKPIVLTNTIHLALIGEIKPMLEA